MDEIRWAKCCESITVHAASGGDVILHPGLCRIEPVAERNLIHQQMAGGPEVTALVTGQELEGWLTGHRLALLGW